MHCRHLNHLFSLALVVTLLAGSVLGAAAQAPQPPASQRPTVPTAQSPLQQGLADLRPWMQRSAAALPDRRVQPHRAHRPARVEFPPCADLR